MDRGLTASEREREIEFTFYYRVLRAATGAVRTLLSGGSVRQAAFVRGRRFSHSHAVRVAVNHLRHLHCKWDAEP